MFGYTAKAKYLFVDANQESFKPSSLVSVVGQSGSLPTFAASAY
jgi:hypothetical protein